MNRGQVAGAGAEPQLAVKLSDLRSRTPTISEFLSVLSSAGFNYCSALISSQVVLITRARLVFSAGKVMSFKLTASQQPPWSSLASSSETEGAAGQSLPVRMLSQLSAKLS